MKRATDPILQIVLERRWNKRNKIKKKKKTLKPNLRQIKEKDKCCDESY